MSQYLPRYSAVCQVRYSAREYWSTLQNRSSLDDIDVIINLAGELIADKPLDATTKAEIERKPLGSLPSGWLAGYVD
ncbi:MAG: hypothetical protein ACR5K7_03540 [Symbiopectobacterium sp.]